MEQKNNIVHGVAFGKLYLAGEYAILEDYSKALLTSVPQKIVTTVEPSEKTTIFDTLHNITVDLYEDNKDYQQTCLNNLQLKENEVKFHAFDLDQGDKFGYWGKKFKQWFKVVKTNDDLKKYSSWFSEYVALAEYFPYHSTQYDSKLDKSFNNKTSYLPTQQFLFNLISKRIVDKDDSVTIIITRSYNKWYEAIPQLKEYKNCYETSNPSNPSLKPENLLKVKRYSAKKEVEKVLDDSLKKL